MCRSRRKEKKMGVRDMRPHPHFFADEAQNGLVFRLGQLVQDRLGNCLDGD
jgi:hypothetical protein